MLKVLNVLLQLLFYKFFKADKYKKDIEDTFQHYWFPGQTIKYTPKGLAWRLQWGSLRYVCKKELFHKIPFPRNSRRLKSL